jgi:tetratricopeptide (TPR) repeat protein
MTNPKPNAETYRIRSLIYLAARNLPEARLEIQKALELEPRWENIQFTAAVVDYFSALSPAILPTQPVAWPEPVDWAYVKRDDESLTRLRKAADVFQTIASGVEKTSEERQNLTSWRLACLVLLPYLVRAAHQSAHCTSSRRAKLARIAIRSRLAERKIGLVRQSTVAVLANDWERQEKAVEYCRGVLQSDPTHHPAIIWAVARNFDVELDPSEAALEKAVEEGPTSIIQILSLVGCYFASRRAEKAIRLLARTKSAFEEHKANALWIYWYVQSLVFKGDFDAAIEVINTADPELDLRTARSVVLGALAEQSGDWQALSEYLDQSYETVGDPNLLFENCRLMAQKQNWAYVATHANQLVEEIGTGEALRLAAIATYNTKRYDLCLRLLNENQKLFGYKLPIELRRLRVSCLHNLGILPDAIAEAEALAREEATIEGLLSLAQLYFVFVN